MGYICRVDPDDIDFDRPDNVSGVKLHPELRLHQDKLWAFLAQQGLDFSGPIFMEKTPAGVAFSTESQCEKKIEEMTKRLLESKEPILKNSYQLSYSEMMAQLQAEVNLGKVKFPTYSFPGCPTDTLEADRFTHACMTMYYMIHNMDHQGHSLEYKFNMLQVFFPNILGALIVDASRRFGQPFLDIQCALEEFSLHKPKSAESGSH